METISPTHYDRFRAGLDDLTRAQQADDVKVLRVLQKTKRFSCFEASENATIGRTITRLIHKAYTRIDADGTRHEYGLLLRTTGGAYPLTNVELTEGGQRLLGESA